MSFDPPTCSTGSSITPDMIQKMIVNTISALGISGTNSSSNSLWYFDSGASNHMTLSPTTLSNTCPYKGNLTVHTADGERLPIIVVGDVPHFVPLTNVSLSFILLITTVMSHSPLLVVLCRIKCRGR